MPVSRQTRLLSLAKSGLLAVIFTLLLLFNPREELTYETLVLSLLVVYHYLTDRRFSAEQIRSTGLVGMHIMIYLLLCTLVVRVTTGEDESAFWIIYLLPIVVAATHLGLLLTLGTCAAASGLYLSMVPSRFFQDPEARREELPELLVFVLALFLVGVLIHFFSEQYRRQLERQRELNRELLEKQGELENSLHLLQAAEEHLRRRERLAAVGEMAAGMAHEIRNPLGIISSSVQLLAGRMPVEGRTGDLLKIVEEETSRLNRLITDFLTFGRPSAPDRQPCDLRELLSRAADHVRALAQRQGVAVNLDLSLEPQNALVDAGMLSQVLLNLLLNALEASSAGGVITLGLKTDPAAHRIRVSDTGCGIPENLREKIFTPFFTTKERGTGLGLANAYRMVERHGGELILEPPGGCGTTFVVHLPRDGEA